MFGENSPFANGAFFTRAKKRCNIPEVFAIMFTITHFKSLCQRNSITQSFVWLYRLAQTVKNLLVMQEDPGLIPGSGRSPWRREWQPTPVFFPRKSHGQRNLVGYSPWGCRVGHDWATNTLSFPFIQHRHSSSQWRGHWSVGHTLLLLYHTAELHIWDWDWPTKLKIITLSLVTEKACWLLVSVIKQHQNRVYTFCFLTWFGHQTH